MTAPVKGQFWRCTADGLAHRILEITSEDGVCTWSEEIPEHVQATVPAFAGMAGYSWLGPMKDFLNQFVFLK